VAKKKSAAKTKTSTKRDILLKELKRLLPQIDEEGLAFLVKQSHTIVYNLHVDEMNRSLAQAERSSKRTSVKKKWKEEEADADKYGVWVEDAPGGGSFIIVLGTLRKVFSRVELRKLVALVNSGSADDGTRSEQLYTWLKKHRGDVLFDGRIEARRHPLLVKLSRYLRTHYTVKK
jgi:hypothetical protein